MWGPGGEHNTKHRSDNRLKVILILIIKEKEVSDVIGTRATVSSEIYTAHSRVTCNQCLRQKNPDRKSEIDRKRTQA